MKFLPLSVACVMLSSVAMAQPKPNYDEALVGSYTLPEAFTAQVENPKQQWEATRRDEILQLFQKNVYGKPVTFNSAKFVSISEKKPLIDGIGYWQIMVLELNGQKVSVLIQMPEAENPPIFIGYNFCGNHSIMTGDELPISDRWANAEVCGHKVDSTTPTTEDGKFLPGSRGIRSYRWPVSDIVSKGYGVVTAYYGDVLPDDNAAFQSYMKQHYPNADAGEHSAIGIWTSGLSVILDNLLTQGIATEDKVAVFGHSRLGKTALWAGATDKRFKMVISNDSGAGGAALARRNYGETIELITTRYPHWFTSEYAGYAKRVNELPVDQHLLLALIAPRALYVASAEDDRWADPKGEFLSLVNAQDIYKLYGSDVFKAKEAVLNQPIHGRMSYHIRPDGHDLFHSDWMNFLTVADIFLR